MFAQGFRVALEGPRTADDNEGLSRRLFEIVVGPARQERLSHRRFDRPREEIALSKLATKGLQLCELLGCFDTFGDDVQPRLCANPTIAWTISVLPSAIQLTNERSILSESIGSRCR